MGSCAKACIAAKGVLGSIDPTHKIFRSSMEDGKASVFWCNRCGCYAAGRVAGLGNTCNGENNSPSRRALRKGQYPGAASRVLGKATLVRASLGRAQAGAGAATGDEEQPRICQGEGSEAEPLSGDSQGDLQEALSFLQSFSFEGEWDF